MREAGQDARGRRPAGFRYAPSGESEWDLALDFPLHLVPGGGLVLLEQATRSPVQPLDSSLAPEIWKVGGDGLELSAILRYQRFPAELMDALRASADGLRLDYYPRLAATNWFFPIQVVGVSRELRAEEDPQRFVHGEYHWRELRIRHLQNGEGNNGDSFDQLLTGNLLLGPRLHRDSDGDGVADEWDTMGSDTGLTPSIEKRAQKLAAAGVGESLVGINQVVFGMLEGDELEMVFELEAANLDGLEIDVRFWNQGGATIDLLQTTVDQPFTRHKLSGAVTAGISEVNVAYRVQATGGGAGNGDAWARDFDLRRVGEAA
jgi:hypothetical protein